MPYPKKGGITPEKKTKNKTETQIKALSCSSKENQGTRFPENHPRQTQISGSACFFPGKKMIPISFFSRPVPALIQFNLISTVYFGFQVCSLNKFPSF